MTSVFSAKKYTRASGMEELLRNFLNQLETIGQVHEDLFDSDVRQEVGNAVMNGFIRNSNGYLVPRDFGMQSEGGNEAVNATICSFVDRANSVAEERGIRSFHERLAAIQNRSVRSIGGYDYEEFIGHTPPEFYDQAGNVRRVV